MERRGTDILVALNESWEAYAGERVTSPILRRHSWRSCVKSLHVGSLPIPSGYQQEASTSHTHELCRRLLDLRHTGLFLSETT